LAQHVDHVHGGLGGAPKFPNSSVFALFLRWYRRTGERRYLDLVTHTLRQMAAGGIYDHLGGGFHRYSVDDRWLVPHFEKMLYDNALLARLYLETYQATGDAFFRGVAEDTLAYVAREMLHPQGGFYATQDADSEGEEGKFFLWTRDEIISTSTISSPRFSQRCGAWAGSVTASPGARSFSSSPSVSVTWPFTTKANSSRE